VINILGLPAAKLAAFVYSASYQELVASAASFSYAKLLYDLYLTGLCTDLICTDLYLLENWRYLSRLPCRKIEKRLLHTNFLSSLVTVQKIIHFMTEMV
jgi:hypothetical protein